MLSYLVLSRGWVVAAETLPAPLHPGEGETGPGAHPGAGAPAVELPAVPDKPAQRPGVSSVSVAAQVVPSVPGQAQVLLEPVTQADT